jgi:protein-S-isoprenylcysteine O-methyltransferase Ste14
MLQLKTLGGIIFTPLFFGVLLFMPAGTLHWWRAWIFLAVVFLCGTVTMLVIGRNQELLDERYRGPYQKGQPLADKIVLSVFVLSFVAVVAFIPFDVFRVQALGLTPPLIATGGLVLFVAGWTVISVALHENTFAAPVVKHQEERHQQTVDTGLYGIVRHPMYASLPLLLPGMALWLGSCAAALLAMIPIFAIALRIIFEEQFLRRELAGYEAYTHKVRYRMIPFVW